MRAIMSLLMALAICVPPLAAQDLQSQDQQSSHILAQIVDKIVEREHQEMEVIRKYSPLVETYVQKVSNKKPDQESWEPDGDR
jgi:DNA-directed RNA polymerase specialized sigma subunit